ncbi:FCD domain-containing protein [Rhodococcus pyridinivorans]|uniref:FCD domain-containing protein n=1 Tax=Rhodococcus pyridinivorans TaxID=103816 RepID=UPI001D13F67A|nr:FCD domain-containing protein [Rhodococcus pyridinivorans]
MRSSASSRSPQGASATAALGRRGGAREEPHPVRRCATRYTPVHFYSDDRSWGTDAVASHERLLQALRTGDVEAAGRETREHFTDGAHRLVKHLDDLGVRS